MEKKSTIIFPFSPILLSNIPKAVKNPMIPAENTCKGREKLIDSYKKYM